MNWKNDAVTKSFYTATPISAERELLASGETLVITSNTMMHNKHLVFTADIDGALVGTVRAGHGKTSYASSYIEINDKEIILYHYYAELSKPTVIEHGLNISDYLTVNIDAAYGTATVTLFTAGGMFQKRDLGWAGRNGDVYVECDGATLSNVSAKWFSDDYSKTVWLFGDSYFNTTYETRWPYYLAKDGYLNNLMTGYPGMGTERALAEFKDALKYGRPIYAVWCMGMNNGDRDGILNEGWRKSTEEFLAICRELDITPILSTIPETPKVSNLRKNEYVRASGYRYIDFNRAVGAHEDANWYPGMLFHDQVHPALEGAKALYAQVLVDFPEIMKDR